MDIRLKKTDRILWEFPDVVAIALLELFPDQVERAKTTYQERLSYLEAEKQKGKPQPGVQIVFTVEKNKLTEKLQLVLRCGSEEVFYSGPPVHAATAFGGGGRTVPARVVEEYARALEYNKPVDPQVYLEQKEKAKPQVKEPSIQRFI